MQVKKINTLWLYTAVNFMVLLVLSGWLYQQNQSANNLPSTQLQGNKLQCVSYAPHYKKGDSPMVEGMWITPEQIDQDLQLISTISRCVRTYSVGQGMDYVAEAAAKIGMKVYLGAWIGWSDADNVKEIKLVTKVANAHSDTVKAIIVGNEVFLRGEQDEAAMQRYFALAKSLSSTPISYADVWEFWIKHQKVARHVDFQTVHILPYWENNPVAVDGAVQHAETVMAKMETVFKKPILIGETGWPSVGRQRSESTPSLVNQARYIRSFVEKAHEKQWQYNLIEAVDQPWKRILEGTVGGYWGLFTFDLKPKFSLTGPVSERHDQYQLVYAAGVGTLLFLGITLMLKERRCNAWLGLGALGALGGILVLLKLEYLVAACRNWAEWFTLGGIAVLGTLMLLMQPWVISGYFPRAKKMTAGIKLIFLYGAVATGYLIYFDGRYRDFPVIIFALPAMIMALGFSARPYNSVLNWLTHAIPSALAVMFAILCFEKELTNYAALLWVLLTVLLAISSWPRQKKHQPQ